MIIDTKTALNLEIIRNALRCETHLLKSQTPVATIKKRVCLELLILPKR